MRYLVYIVLLVATACTLTTAAPTTPQPTPLDFFDIPAEETEEPAADDENSDGEITQPEENSGPATTIPIVDNGGSQPVQNNPTCIPRADWGYRYTVQPGDTLTKIAQRGNTTASTLASGNCLTNANVISVGQVLRTPNPVTAPLPPTVQPNPNDQQGTVFISSFISADAGNFLLLRDEVISLRWDNPPANLYRATFIIQTPGSGAITQIAEDTNPSNGVTASWKVPAGLHGNLMAQGRYLNSNAVTVSFPSSVSSAPPYGLGCELTAVGGSTVSAYNQPDYSSGVFLNIAPGDYHETLGRSLNGWFAISPPNDAPYTSARLKWIPIDNNLRGRGNCPPDVPSENTPPGNNTYTNADVGFALDYPAGWSQQNGGNYVDFIAPDGRTFEILFSGMGLPPAEEAAACIEAPLCIGDRKILGQYPVTLPDGLDGYRLELSASLTKPDTTPAVYVFARINNQNIVFRGFSQTLPTFFENILGSLRLLQF